MFRITMWWIFACVPTLGCARTSPVEWLRQLGPADVIYCTDRSSNRTYEITDEGKQSVKTVLLNATDFDSLPPGQGPVHPPFVIEFDLRIELESGEAHTIHTLYPSGFRVDGVLYLSTRADYARLKAQLVADAEEVPETRADAMNLPKD